MPVVMDKRLTDKIVRYFATQPIVKAWAHDAASIMAAIMKSL